MKFGPCLPAFAIAIATACLMTGIGKSQEFVPARPILAAQPQINTADTIYTGGDIVTINDKQTPTSSSPRSTRCS